ncbi:MAG: CBS domain-containing protein [Acidobacteriota bacterium]|nr:CBS domain-containing protein [Acidobacteriota bacterium]
MNVSEIMTPNPTCCTPETGLQEVARMMVDNDCGEIPVVENFDTRIPVGVVTDRDITCRTVAKGLNPLEMSASDCMTPNPVSVRPDLSVEECGLIMEDNKIRRILVVDETGACTGIVALADLASNATKTDAGDILQEVSASTASASGTE